MRNHSKPGSSRQEFLSRLVLLRHDPTLLTDVLPQARAGNADAQYAMGLIYAEGRGVTPDLHESYIWLSRAVAQGDSEAGILREMLMNQMTLEEIRMADKTLIGGIES